MTFTVFLEWYAMLLMNAHINKNIAKIYDAWSGLQAFNRIQQRKRNMCVNQSKMTNDAWLAF